MKELRSSIHELEMFKRSNVWKDLEEWAHDVLEDVRGKMETLEDTTTLYRLQGEAITLRRIMAWPDVMIEFLEKEIERRSKQNEEEEEDES